MAAEAISKKYKKFKNILVLFTLTVFLNKHYKYKIFIMDIINLN